MSKYKVGDKVVFTVTGMTESGQYPDYILNYNFFLWKQGIDNYAEPLSTYTEPLEAKIQKQSAEILKQKEIIDKLLNENEKLMFKIDAYELYGDQHKEEYNQAFNQGAEAAWELARKITCQPINGGFKRSEFEEIFNEGYISDIFEKYTYPEAAAKVAEWEKAKEEIKAFTDKLACDKLSDIISHNNAENKALNNPMYWWAGSVSWRLENMKKTGRHIDVDSFLKQIGEE